MTGPAVFGPSEPFWANGRLERFQHQSRAGQVGLGLFPQVPEGENRQQLAGAFLQVVVQGLENIWGEAVILDAAQRRLGWEAQKPITIGDGVWLGGG